MRIPRWAVALVVMAVVAESVVLAWALATRTDGDDVVDATPAATSTTGGAADPSAPGGGSGATDGGSAGDAGDDGATPSTVPAASPPPVATGPPPEVVVVGNQLVDEDGAPVRLIGVNRAGTEYACVDGYGFHDGPSDATTAALMASWGVNAVRVLLNESCWLGLPTVPEGYRGQLYRDAIVEWVDVLHEHGMVVVLALVWSDPGDGPARSQAPMPNTAHSIEFWSSVAETFRDDRSLLFELYGEPHEVEWECVRDGCTLDGGPDGPYEAAGLQELLDAVRDAGADQPVIVNGPSFANDVSRWQEFAPTDPADQLVVGFHLYDFTICIEVGCWDEHLAPLAERWPVVTSELGEAYCETDFLEAYADWADEHGVSYLAWTWNPWGQCALGYGQPAYTGSDLIEDFDGTPTPAGAWFRERALAANLREPG